MAGTSDRVRSGNSYPVDPRWGGSAGKGLPPVERRSGTVPTYELTEEEPASSRQVEVDARLHHESMGFENLATDPEIQERAKAAVQLSMRDTYNVMESLRNKWLTLYRLYRGDTIAQIVQGQIPLHEPEPFKAVETVHPRLMREIFKQDPIFGLDGYEWEDDEAAKHQIALITAQLKEQDWESTCDILLRELLIYGTCIQKTFWRQDIREVQYQRVRRVPTERVGIMKPELIEVKREELIYDGNVSKPVSIFDFFGPPTLSPQDAPWMGDQSLWPSYEIMRMGELGLWVNLDELRDHPGGEVTSLNDEYKERKFYSAGVYDTREATMSPHVAHYKCLDWWGPLDITKKIHGGKEVMCNVTILDPDSKNLVVSVRQHPNWHGQMPYQLCRWIALHEELFGIGLIEPVARMSFELDSKKNQYHVATALEANPMIVMDDTANIHDNQLIATPGLVIRGATSDAAKPFMVPRVSDAALQAMGELKNSIRETHGVTSPIAGYQTAASKTLGQHTSEVNEASLRILGGLKRFEKELELPMINQMAWNNMQFLSRPKTVRILGAQGLRYQDRYTVKPENITGRFKAYAVASERLTTQLVQVQQLINLLDRAPQLNQVMGEEIIKVRPLLMKIFREGFGFKDAAEFITIDPRDAGLLASEEEHEAWMNGVVPRVNELDAHVDHYQSHYQFMQSESFAWLEANMPNVAAEAIRHAVEHLAKMTGDIEIYSSKAHRAADQGALSQLAQNGQMGGGGPSAGGRGFNAPGQSPESPNFRRESPNDNMPQTEEGMNKSEGTRSGPNPGAS